MGEGGGGRYPTKDLQGGLRVLNIQHDDVAQQRVKWKFVSSKPV